MYNIILVPLDGSKRAEAILTHIKELARLYNAKVVFLRVIEHEPFSFPETSYKAEYHDQTEALAALVESYLDGLKKDFSDNGIDCMVRIMNGPIVDAIVNTAEQENADLIAIASHGRTGLQRVFYGSVAAGVLHRINRPLLLVRSRNVHPSES
ncbi:universal stress protein [Thermodesulfobacteriota bacterium]